MESRGLLIIRCSDALSIVEGTLTTFSRECAEAAEFDIALFLAETGSFIDVRSGTELSEPPQLEYYDHVVIADPEIVFVSPFSASEAGAALAGSSDSALFSLTSGLNLCEELIRRETPPFTQVGSNVLQWREGRLPDPLSSLRCVLLRAGREAAGTADRAWRKIWALLRRSSDLPDIEPPQFTFQLSCAAVLPEDRRTPLSGDREHYSLSGYVPVTQRPAPRMEIRESPSISVVIPCFLQAHFLPAAVRSIQAQSYAAHEIIIVNDGSPDETSAVVRKLAAAPGGSNIRLVEQRNLGLAEARNTGIRNASGDWILAFDSDDIFAATFLEDAVREIGRDPRLNLISPSVQEFGARFGTWVPDDYHPEQIRHWNFFCGNSLFRRALWEQAGGYYPGIPWGAEDWNFWISCSEIGIRPHRFRQRHFFYRRPHAGSMFDTLSQHKDEVDAIICTLHPHLYAAEKVAESHRVLQQMTPETDKKVRVILKRFPNLAMPHFWLGLNALRLGDIDTARVRFRSAYELGDASAWQVLPYWLLACRAAYQKGAVSERLSKEEVQDITALIERNPIAKVIPLACG